jgi:nucleotide-binding universal stress UspA family protein
VPDGRRIVASLERNERVQSLARETGVTLLTTIREGAPGEQTLAAVGGEEASVVVMGTHGRDRIRPSPARREYHGTRRP